MKRLITRRLIAAVTQEDLDRVLYRTRNRLNEAVEAYLREGDERAFGGRVLEALEDGYTKAVYLGRHRAGDIAPPENDDRLFAQYTLREQTPYLEGFISDLSDGDYPEAKLRNRALSYVGRVLGVANEAFVLASDSDELFYWILGGNENNCGECPDRAKRSPYRKNELPGFPGDCSTKCLMNCKCHLVRSDGVSSFRTTV